MNIAFLKSYNGISATANVKPFKADDFYGVIQKRRAYNGNIPTGWICDMAIPNQKNTVELGRSKNTITNDDAKKMIELYFLTEKFCDNLARAR